MDRKFLIELILEHSDKDDIRRIMRDIGTLEIRLTPSFTIKLKGVQSNYPPHIPMAVTATVTDEGRVVGEEVLNWVDLHIEV